jgi:hypothetical protein
MDVSWLTGCISVTRIRIVSPSVSLSTEVPCRSSTCICPETWAGPAGAQDVTSNAITVNPTPTLEFTSGLPSATGHLDETDPLSGL